MKNKKLLISIISLVIIILFIVGIIVINANKKPKDLTVTHTAIIEIKDYGNIALELYGNMAPITVKNFTSLAQNGFYDGLSFHRIIEGFMMQGGDPEKNGLGGSDKKIKGEFALNGIENTISHTRGIISMARSQSYNSASSQFFIVQQDSVFLDGQYAAFGVVTSGMEVVDKICSKAKPIDDNGSIEINKQPVIKKIVVKEAKIEN